MDKILRIDVGAEGGPKVKVTPVGEYAGLGGRAMTSAIVSKEVPPLCHPLGAENKLVISPGILSGTTGSLSGRISVGCKSPLTGAIKEANAGGQAAQVLARLGYAAVILEGKPKATTSTRSSSTRMASRSRRTTASGCWTTTPGREAEEGVRRQGGLHVHRTCRGEEAAGRLHRLHRPGAAADPPLRPRRRGCGHGRQEHQGDHPRRRRHEDASAQGSGKVPGRQQAFVEGLRKHPVTGEGLPAYGTNVLTNVLNEAGGYPTYNFKQGQFAGSSKISGETAGAAGNAARRRTPPTAATAAASSSAPASTTTRTATT